MHMATQFYAFVSVMETVGSRRKQVRVVGFAGPADSKTEAEKSARQVAMEQAGGSFQGVIAVICHGHYPTYKGALDVATREAHERIRELTPDMQVAGMTPWRSIEDMSPN
jgi:hypothetical protein